MAIGTCWDLGCKTQMSSVGAQAPDREESGWIAASRNGDRTAFEHLVKRYEHRVFRLAGRFFRRPEEIEDVAQETFLTVWRKLGTYRAKAPFEHWLTRVCLNCCYARFRKRCPEETGLSDLAPASEDRDPGVLLEARRLLASLEPEDRFVLQLLHGEGWSTAEIADRLGWSRSKVKVRAHRARRRLRARLSGGEPR